MKPSDFQELIWEKARELYRDMPWRQDTRPYYVMVSEIMLQQTQVSRVIEKFRQFVERFPDIQTLAKASLADVLTMWSGLGYNRRARYLHQAARQIVEQNDGEFPETIDQLKRLPGIGANTAGAILVYSFNQPVVFIETNIRTVYFHHFFNDDIQVSDKDLKELVAATVDPEHPREFYWALMDYGAELKRQGFGNVDKSKHYKKQSPLKGSIREIRGLIVQKLTDGPITVTQLERDLPNDDRFNKALDGLIKDGMVIRDNDTIRFT